MIKKLLIAFTALLLIVPITLFLTLKISPLSWQLLGPVNEDNDLAVKGYDVIEYMYNKHATAGLNTKGLRYNDVIWYFSSEENKVTFKAFPEKFLPQYGGYCAWAVSQGYTASTDPTAWRVVDNKLYLNYSHGVQRQWAEDIPGNIAKADKYWPKVLE